MKLKYEIGDAFELVKGLEPDSIDCVVTSPPYWGLRDYGVNEQLGLEPDFNQYLKRLWGLFDDIKIALKDTGTAWINLGDSYNNTTPGARDADRWPKQSRNDHTPSKKTLAAAIGLKSLCMMPQRFAVGMVDRGWILRNVIIWHKPSCMPESVKDRFTVDFEYLYFFVKNQKYYFKTQYEDPKDRTFSPFNKRVRDVKKGRIASAQYTATDKEIAESNKHGVKHNNNNYGGGGAGFKGHSGNYDKNGEPLGTLGKRNKRTTWSLSTKAFSEAHFATFPPELIETPIKAGCPPNGTVLDPFLGSGTTLEVCRKLNRSCIGFELNPDYEPLIRKRALLDVPIIDQFSDDKEEVRG